MNLKKILLSFVLLLSLQKGLAQTDTTINDYYIDFSVPDLGAFTLLNTKPDNISTPGNTKELAASLLNIVGSGASISPGLAIDWAPARTLGHKKSPQYYQKTYLLQNLQLNLGTTQDTSGSNVGLGLKWVFCDKTDPLLDTALARALLSSHHDRFLNKEKLASKYAQEKNAFLKKMEAKRNFTKADVIYFDDTLVELLNVKSKALQKKDLVTNYMDVLDRINYLIKKYTVYRSSALDTTQTTESERQVLMKFCKAVKDFDMEQTNYREVRKKDFEKIKKDWLNKNWNRSVWLVGAGWVGISSDNKWKTLGNKYFKSYVNGKVKCGNRSQFVFIGTYTMPEVKTKTDSTILSRAFVGTRFLVGNAANRFSIDLGYGQSLAKKSSFNLKELVATMGFEFKLNDGIFLEIAGGLVGPPSKDLINDSANNSSILAMGSLKYAFNKKKRFDTGGTEEE